MALTLRPPSQVSFSTSSIKVVLKVVDIDPQRSIGPSKGSINNQGVEWDY